MDYSIFASGPRKGQCKLVRDRIIRYLVEGEGYTVVNPSIKSTKISTNDPDRFIYVGKNGSVRIGRTKTSSGNIAQTIMQRMINWEKDQKI